jgi:hydrogenase maturation factor
VRDINLHTGSGCSICIGPNRRIPKCFLNAKVTVSKALNTAKLKYEMRELAADADVVPGRAMNSLLSTSKLADANYVTVFMKDEVKIFDAATAPFQLEGKVVMQGWRYPKTKLWRVPLQEE